MSLVAQFGTHAKLLIFYKETKTLARQGRSQRLNQHVIVFEWHFERCCSRLIACFGSSSFSVA